VKFSTFFSLGNSFDVISVSTKVLKHMEFDRLKCNHVVSNKSNISLLLLMMMRHTPSRMANLYHIS
jgi:hypothetical protein